MGANLCEQVALRSVAMTKRELCAKDDVDNVGAGRTAKGANPLLCAKIGRTAFVVLPIFFVLTIEKRCESSLHENRQNGFCSAYFLLILILAMITHLPIYKKHNLLN